MGTQLHLATASEGLLDALVRVTQAVKVKDAASLGVLAYACSTGDCSVLSGDAEDRHVQRVAEAISNPQGFWDWAAQKCSREEQRLLLASSLKAYRRGGRPWYRPFIQAAAYLAVTNGVPDVRVAE